MLLGELFTAIDSTLRRPDKVDYIKQQIIAALRALHSSQEFSDNYIEWDIPNSDVTVDGLTTGKGSFTYSSDVRNPSLIFAYDSTGTQTASVELSKAMELEKRKKANQSLTNTCYRTGSKSISFQLESDPYAFVLSGYTHRPELSVTTNSDGSAIAWTDANLLAYHDWLLDIYPAVVLDYVIGYVASALGEKEISNIHLSMYRNIHLPILESLGSVASS